MGKVAKFVGGALLAAVVVAPAGATTVNGTVQAVRDSTPIKPWLRDSTPIKPWVRDSTPIKPWVRDSTPIKPW